MKQLVLRRSMPCGIAFLSCMLLALLSGPAARAQASYTATRSIGLSAFGGATGLKPEYGGAPNDYGFFLGGDVSRHLHLLTPGLEVRYTRATGSLVNESSFTGALKLEKPLGPGFRFHPYVNVGVGHGAIVFNHPLFYNGVPYKSDTAFLYGFGGGIDVDVTEHFAIKGDYQYQRWNVGSEQSVFTPGSVNVGVVYRFAF